MNWTKTFVAAVFGMSAVYVLWRASKKEEKPVNPLFNGFVEGLDDIYDE